MKINFTTAALIFIALLPLKFLWRQAAIHLANQEDANAQSLAAAMTMFES